MMIETKTTPPTSLSRNWEGWQARVAAMGAVRRPLAIVGILGVMLLVGLLQNVPVQAASSMKTTVHTPGKKHTTDPKAGTQSIIHLPSTPKLPGFTPQKTEPPMSHTFPAQCWGRSILRQPRQRALLMPAGHLKWMYPLAR